MSARDSRQSHDGRADDGRADAERAGGARPHDARPHDGDSQDRRGLRGAALSALAPALPGRGATLERWRLLAALTQDDIVEGRLAEAHLDAVAITTDLGEPDLVRPGSHWGVWAAEPPSPQVRALRTPGGWVLDGTKPWCSGASLCTHALVTAAEADGTGFFAVDLTRPGVRAVPDTWPAVGMAASDSGWVSFDRVPALRLGSHADYLERPGFWHGGMGVAACWFGGARAVAVPLLERAAKPGASPFLRAHAGAVVAELASAWALLTATAREVDADPDDTEGLVQRRALLVRTRIDRAASAVIERTGRATGAGPLCADGQHAQRVADLAVYIRQSHAEADEAQIAPEDGAGGSGAAAWDRLIGLDPPPSPRGDAPTDQERSVDRGRPDDRGASADRGEPDERGGSADG